ESYGEPLATPHCALTFFGSLSGLLTRTHFPFLLLRRLLPTSTLFPYTTLFRSLEHRLVPELALIADGHAVRNRRLELGIDHADAVRRGRRLKEIGWALRRLQRRQAIAEAASRLSERVVHHAKRDARDALKDRRR